MFLEKIPFRLRLHTHKVFIVKRQDFFLLWGKIASIFLEGHKILCTHSHDEMVHFIIMKKTHFSQNMHEKGCKS